MRAGKRLQDIDLFGEVSWVWGAGVSNAGRPRLPMRLMVSLLYLKHAYNVGDEELVSLWSENVYWQVIGPDRLADQGQSTHLNKVSLKPGLAQFVCSWLHLLKGWSLRKTRGGSDCEYAAHLEALKRKNNHGKNT